MSARIVKQCESTACPKQQCVGDSSESWRVSEPAAGKAVYSNRVLCEQNHTGTVKSEVCRAVFPTGRLDYSRPKRDATMRLAALTRDTAESA